MSKSSDIRLDLETARRVVAGARARGREMNLAPLAVVVLDSGGHILAVEREDGAAFGRFEIAYGKAHGAIALGMGSRVLMARAEQQAYFVAAAAAALDGALVPVPGGVLIADAKGVVVGAVGVSGDSSDNDEAVAVAGIEGAGGSAVTG